MQRASSSERAASWGRYWASGARHSCAASFGSRYGSSTRAFWEAQFRRLDSTDCVIELGCGNGSMFDLMANMEPMPVPALIHAVDLAELDQRWIDALPALLRARLMLHPRTSAEALPISSGCVTRLFSQYAFEYFATDAVWAELRRVLAPRVSMALVVHHEDSLPCRISRAELEHCDWLLESEGLLEQAHRMIPLFAEAALPGGKERLSFDVGALRAREQFNLTLAMLERRAEESLYADILHDVASRLMQILRSIAVSGHEQARVQMSDLRQAVWDNRLRVAELVECALNGSDVTRWVGTLAAEGFRRCDVGELIEQGHLFGWTICADRDA